MSYVNILNYRQEVIWPYLRYYKIKVINISAAIAQET
jgi:hypothetical protein